MAASAPGGRLTRLAPRLCRRRVWSSVAAVLEILGVLLTAGLAVLTVGAAQPPQAWSVVVFVTALVWGVAGTIADLHARLGRWQRRFGSPVAMSTNPEVRRDNTADDTGFTTVMRMGDVPHNIARTTATVAAEAGPVVLVVCDAVVPDGLPDSVTVVGDSDPARAMALAVEQVGTESTLLVSARALPDGDVCGDAASLLGCAPVPDGVCSDDSAPPALDWIVGASQPLNRDRFGPDRADLVDAPLRRRSVDLGLWLWEPNAVLVRTDLLRAHPLRTERPLGSWLRGRAQEGRQGDVVDRTLTLRGVPVSSHGYWPEAVARQRAQVADLSDAMRRRAPLRARVQAALLLCRALGGWSAVLWMLTFVMWTDSSPIHVDAAARFGSVLGFTLLLRWLALRASVGVRVRPVVDVLSALYRLPGSLAATGAAFTRRVRRPRLPFPARPVVWMALGVSVVAANGLLSSQTGDGSKRTAAAVGVVLLGLVWVLTVRSLVERDWARTAFRVPLDLPATLSTDHEGLRGRVVDGSPSGFAFAGRGAHRPRGEEVEVTAELSGGNTVELVGTIASCRRRGRVEDVLGIELRSLVGPPGWPAELVRGARSGRRAGRRSVEERDLGTRSRAVRALDRVVVSIALAVSLLVVVTLTLVLLGIRPLVVRSGSMEPTYSVGDVVLVESRTAGDLKVGDVATRFDDPDALDSLTHRVVAIDRAGGEVTIETRGDANSSSEVWTVPLETRVGLVVVDVPVVGRPATIVRNSAAWMVLGGVSLGVVGLGLLLVPRVRRPAVRRERPRKDRISYPHG